MPQALDKHLFCIHKRQALETSAKFAWSLFLLEAPPLLSVWLVASQNLGGRACKVGHVGELNPSAELSLPGSRETGWGEVTLRLAVAGRAPKGHGGDLLPEIAVEGRGRLVI